MKRIAFVAGLILISAIARSQKTIDALFERYANSDGFVTVTINGDILKFAASLENDDDDNDLDFLPGKITRIRILALEDDNRQADNFYNLVTGELDLRDYEELMRVKESDQDFKILVRTEGTHIREMLMIAGGKDNALVQITGDITRSEAKRISEHVEKNNGSGFISGNR